MVEEIAKEVEAVTAELPKVCKNSKCCGRYALFAEQGENELLMPLTKVTVKSELWGAMTTTNVELTYVNPC